MIIVEKYRLLLTSPLPIDCGQGILIAFYDQVKSGCLDLKKANCEIWAKEVTNGQTSAR